MKKKIIALLTVVLMTVSLAACGGKGNAAGGAADGTIS